MKINIKVITFDNAFLFKKKGNPIHPFNKNEYIGTYTNSNKLQNFFEVWFGENISINEKLNNEGDSNHLGSISVYEEDTNTNYLFNVYEITPNEL